MTLKILSAEAMADATWDDFRLYFNDGAMVYNISPLKTRLFVPSGDNGLGSSIHGVYLSREKLWKEKTVKWEGWHKILRYIPPFPIGFNIGEGAGYWEHNMSKNGTGAIGYRKAFPVHNTLRLSIAGITSASEKTLQNVVFHAFGDIYGTATYIPIGHPLVAKRKATWTAQGILVDLTSCICHYRGNVIGACVLKNGNVYFSLNKSARHLYGLFREGGVDASRIFISEK